MKTTGFLILFLASLYAHGQFDPNYKQNDYSTTDEEPAIVNIGFGLGINYGGVGAKLSAFPVPEVGVFGAVGYNFLQAGYNFGLVGRVLPRQKVCPIATVMYGYNAVIIIEGLDELNETYYGLSFGGGIEIRFGGMQNYLSIEGLIPLHGEAFRDDLTSLRNNPRIQFSGPSPIQVSIGYHMRL